MAYIDTSVLTAYYCPEPLSQKAQDTLSKDIPTISNLTEVEFASALSRKVRLKELASEDASRIMAVFETHLQSNVYERVYLEFSHYELAKNWIGQMKIPLRTLDALHLTVAATQNMQFVTADKPLAKAAKTLGIKVSILS